MANFRDWLREQEAEHTGMRSAPMKRGALEKFMETDPTPEECSAFLRAIIDEEQARRKKEDH